MAAYATLADIARIYRITERTARRWAEVDQWRRVGTTPARYAITDAQASYDARTRQARIMAHLERRYAWMLPSTGDDLEDLAVCATGCDQSP